MMKAYKAGEETLRRLRNINTIRIFFCLCHQLNVLCPSLEPICCLRDPSRWSCVLLRGDEERPAVQKLCQISRHQDRPSKVDHLSREPFDLSTLQSKLCDIARVFLCARWHRQRQADQVGQRWYEAASATRRKCRMALELPLHPLRIRASARCRQSPGVALHQATPTGHLTGSDKTHRCGCQPTLSQCNHSIHL